MLGGPKFLMMQNLAVHMVKTMMMQIVRILVNKMMMKNNSKDNMTTRRMRISGDWDAEDIGGWAQKSNAKAKAKAKANSKAKGTNKRKYRRT